MLDNRINNASDKLDQHFKNHTFDENTNNALLYFLSNKNKLKYLLQPYTIAERQAVLLAHFENEFGKINKHMMKPILDKAGIYSNTKFSALHKKCVMLLSAIATLIVMCIIESDYLIIPIPFIDFSIFALITYIILYAIFYMLIYDCTRYNDTSRYRTYTLTKEYKHLAVPKKTL